MKIATLEEFTARATIEHTRNVNPAQLRPGDTIIGGPTVKSIDYYDALSKTSSCRPECVHINRTMCYDTRVDVQVKR